MNQLNTTGPLTDPLGWVAGTLDAKYDVERVVGEGGFGVVYLARHRGFGDAVAIKCLKIPSSLRAADRQIFREAFLAEGRLLRQLSRENASIVQALDAGDAISPAGIWTPYLVLEWLDGWSLETELRRRTSGGVYGMSLHEACAVLDPVVQAVATAHSHNIAHRDIKPSNIFLTRINGKLLAKILDFGIAKVISETASLSEAYSATGHAMRAFTPGYGAPEQFHKRFGATGTWTDVFALALVLVELVTGRRALEGDDVTQLFFAASDQVYRPTIRNRGVPTSDQVESILAKALAVDPRQRYRTANDFWSALQTALLTNSDGYSSNRRPAVIADLESAATVPPQNWDPRLTPLPTTPPSVLAQSQPTTTGNHLVVRVSDPGLVLPQGSPIDTNPAAALPARAPTSRGWLPWAIISLLLMVILALFAPAARVWLEPAPAIEHMFTPIFTATPNEEGAPVPNVQEEFGYINTLTDGLQIYKRAILRDKPDLAAREVTRIEHGMRLKIVGRAKGNWYKVTWTDDENQTAWIHGDVFKSSPPPPATQ